MCIRATLYHEISIPIANTGGLFPVFFELPADERHQTLLSDRQILRPSRIIIIQTVL